MYLGVVARPRPEKNFNGRIVLKRVSRTSEVTAKTRNQNFSADVKVNCALQYETDWHELCAEGMTCADLCDSVSQFYDLSEFVSERLELYFPDYNSNGEEKTGKYKHRAIKADEVLSSVQRCKFGCQNEKENVQLADIKLAVRCKEGDKVTKDASCDSKWMLDTMGEVGVSIRDAFHWIPATQTIYLIMDNAGGHGTDKAVENYTKELFDEFNIKVVQQVPRSPETNVLDLGVWMSLQSSVEKEHHGKKCDADALDSTVMRVWDAVASVDAFQNVFGKLPTIYANIKNNQGGNDTVEANRGKVGAAKIAAQEEDRRATAVDEGEPLFTLDAFEDEDIEDDLELEEDEDEGIVNLL